MYFPYNVITWRIKKCYGILNEEILYQAKRNNYFSNCAQSRIRDILTFHGYLEMSEGDKTKVRQYLFLKMFDAIKEGGMHFLVYGEFKKVTSDEDKLREVLVAAKEGDTDKLNKILDDL